MSFAAAVLSGFVLPVEGLALLARSRGTKRYLILPVLFGLVVYSLLFFASLALLSTWSLDFADWHFWGDFGRHLSGWVNASAGILKWIIAIPALLAVSYLTFSMVTMVIASPFNDMLSLKLLENLTTRDQPVLAVGWRSTVRSLGDSAWVVARQLFWTVLCLPFLLLPLAGALPLVLVTAYFAGTGFVAVAAAQHDLRRQRRNRALKPQRARILGLGLAMEILFLIPFGAIFMLPLGVAAGTLLFAQCDWTESTPSPTHSV